MNAADRRRLLDLIRSEESAPRRFPEVLGDFAAFHDTREHEWWARLFAILETADRARIAHLDRSQWHRQFSTKLVRVLIFFGFLSGAGFLLWGGEEAFLPCVFFLGGGTAFYLLSQTLAQLRSRKNDEALREVETRCRSELQELSQRIERVAADG